MCFKFCFGSSTSLQDTNLPDVYNKNFSEVDHPPEIVFRSRKKSSKRIIGGTEEEASEQYIEKSKRRDKKSRESKRSPSEKTNEEQVAEQIVGQIRKKSKHPSQPNKKESKDKKRSKQYVYTDTADENKESRKRESRSPKRREKDEKQIYDRELVNLEEEMYNKQIPYEPCNTDGTFINPIPVPINFSTLTYDQYGQPIFINQDVKTPEIAEQVAFDNNSASIKMNEKESDIDLKNYSDTEKNTKLSRQIPIIKIIGDIGEASTLNINDVPTYKSDSLFEIKSKKTDQNIFKKLKKNLNLLTEMGLLKSSKTKVNVTDKKTTSSKKVSKKSSILARNLALFKELNVPKKGPRLIKAPSKAKALSTKLVEKKGSSSSTFSRESSTDKLNELNFRSGPDINSALSLGRTHGSDQSTGKEFNLESKSNFTKSNGSIRIQLPVTDSRASATSERFNVTSKTECRPSSQSISKVNPFTSLSKFIKKDVKADKKKSVKISKSSVKNLKDLKKKEKQQKRPSDTDLRKKSNPDEESNRGKSRREGSLLSVAIKSSDKLNK